MTSGSETADALLTRLDAVADQLAFLAAARETNGTTEPDPTTGERWEPGQVWGHLAEFLPYWVGQARQILAAEPSEPAPFGRTRVDPGRLAAIERGRDEFPEVLFARTRAGIEEVRRFIRGLGPSDWARRGNHPTLGPMTIERVVEEFIVGHLEEHAAQLEAVRPT